MRNGRPHLRSIGAALLWATSLAAVWSCGSDGGAAGGATDPGTSSGGAGADAAGSNDAATTPPPATGGDAGNGGGDAASSGDSGRPPQADSGPPPGATYRNSLSVCWNDPSCPRALAISHGGDWNVAGPPYDSNAALSAAYDHGSDGVKIDVRYTMDGVGVISHSSPIQTYESLDCSGKKIEEMTVAQVTACHRFPSNETFQRLDDVLDALRGKLVIQLCVKVNTEFGKTITDVLAKNAQDFAFVEANSGDFPAIVPLPGADKVYYVVNVGTTVADIDTVLGYKNPRIIMVEIDPSVALNGMAAQKIHPGGARAFTYDNSSTSTAATYKGYFDEGFDVVSSNLTAPDIQARQEANQARGVTPP